ncbi:MAG: hypothetical protein ABI995_16225 [Acidobacteriota bacterium]
MYFNPTPTNMVAVLISSLAFVGIGMLMRKRYDSNIPLLFYFFAVPFTTMFERPVHPVILYTSLAFALLLRFEFMGSSFLKLIAFMAGAGLSVMIYALLSETAI